MKTYSIEQHEEAAHAFDILRKDGTVVAFAFRNESGKYDVLNASNLLHIGYNLPSLGDVIRVCETYL